MDEVEEAKALRAADFVGLPREALVATIHYLADVVLRLYQLSADKEAGR